MRCPTLGPSTLVLALMLMSEGEGSETFHTCHPVPQFHELLKIEQRETCTMLRGWQVWPPPGLRLSIGGSVWTPKEEKNSHLISRKETRWIQNTYPSRTPDGKGGLVTGTLVSRVGQVWDMALCPPFLARHSCQAPPQIGRPGLGLPS